MAIKFLSDISLQKGQIKDVSLERLAADPTGADAFEGRIYYNTGNDTVRYKAGSGFVTLATSGYSNWVLDANGSGSGVDIDDGNTVDFAAGTGLTVARASKTITYTIAKATSSALGGVAVNYTTDSDARNYKVCFDKFTEDFGEILNYNLKNGVDDLFNDLKTFKQNWQNTNFSNLLTTIKYSELLQNNDSK